MPVQASLGPAKSFVVGQGEVVYKQEVTVFYVGIFVTLRSDLHMAAFDRLSCVVCAQSAIMGHAAPNRHIPPIYVSPVLPPYIMPRHLVSPLRFPHAPTPQYTSLP